MNYIIAVGVFQALIALAVFWGSKQKRPADNILMWLVLCIFTHLSIKFVIFTSVEYQEVRRQLVTFIGLAYGPLLYMYARKVRDHHYHPYQHWFLLLPTLLAAVWYMAVVVFIMATGKVPHPVIDAYNDGMLVFTTAFGGFGILSLRIANRLPGFWSGERKLITHISLLFICLPVTSLLLSYILPLFHIDIENYVILARSIIYALLVLLVVRIAHFRLSLYQLMNRPVNPNEIEHHEPEVPVMVVAEVVEEDRTARKQQHQSAVMQKLDERMRKDKLYRDADLTLEKLAALFGLTRNHLSETLNQHAGKSFYQYVNEFRVQEVISSLDKCRSGSVIPNLLILAYDAGFKSKSSFNLYFKKITQHTPSEYLRQEQYPLVPTDSIA